MTAFQKKKSGNYLNTAINNGLPIWDVACKTYYRVIS